MKQKLYLFNKGMKIACVFSEVENSKDIIVFFHGFTGDKDEANKLFVKAEEYFNRHCFSTFRFDFRFSKTDSNSSESDGRITDMLPSEWISDGLLVTRKIKEMNKFDRIHLIGLSMGGLVGIHVAANERVNSLVLWSSVVDSEALLSRSSDYSWIKNTVCNKYENFIKDFINNSPIKICSQLTYIPLLIVAGEKDTVVPVEQAKLLNRCLSDSRLHIIKDADHVFSTKIEELLEITFAFLKSNFSIPRF